MAASNSMKRAPRVSSLTAGISIVRFGRSFFASASAVARCSTSMSLVKGWISYSWRATFMNIMSLSFGPSM